MATPRLSLAQQIALLDQPAPLDVDPEDDVAQPTGSPEPEDASAAAREHYLDVGPSALRRAQQSISDPKYEGVKTSRSALLDDSDGFVRSDDEPSGSDDGDVPSSNAEEQSESEDEDEDAPAHPKDTKSRVSEGEPEPEQDLAATLRQTRDSDVKKGKAVKRQLNLWDTLLDARIRMQKSVVNANRLPPPAQISQFISEPRCLAAQHALLTEALALNDELSLLREELMRREDVNVDASPRPGKRRRIDDRQDGDGKDATDGDAQRMDEDWEECVHDASEWAVELDHIYHPHLTHTLAKWSAKIAAVAPSALLPSSHSFSRGKGGVQGVGPQVDAMMSGVEGERLRARTRVRRGKGGRIRTDAGPEGDAAADGAGEEDPELFDDTDFYQQLLRDVIDAKSGAGGAGEDWKALQKERKKRKGVDTKASKGRKLRYEVHEKLQHFMVPVPLPGGGWHEEQIDELFASLLGKGFEDSAMAVDEDAGAARTEVR